MHLDDGQIQRLVHDDPDAADGRSLREHADRCASCGARLGAARLENERIGLLLREVDHPLPPVNVETIMARVKTPRARALSRAAGIVLILGAAGVASAAPGSPIRAWFEGRTSPAAPSEDGPASGSQAATVGGGGIAVQPGPRLVIDFAGAAAGATAAVYLTDAAEVTVETLDAEARFISDPVGRLRVVVATAGHFRVGIPRNAPLVEITVAGRRVLVGERGRISGATPDAAGTYTVRVGER